MTTNVSVTGMKRARWEYLKALDVGPGRYIHVSCDAQMLPNPNGPHFQMVPWVQRPGSTFNVGRNKAKRERREAAKTARIHQYRMDGSYYGSVREDAWKYLQRENAA